MEYQIVSEISSFWENLMLPITMGSLTIIFFLWIIGKRNRNYLADKILADDSNKYVLSNGIYVPKKITKGNILKQKLKEISGFSDLRPVILIFLLILLMFGVYRIVLEIFLPSLTISTPNVLFASGIEEYLLADIWKRIPQAKDLNQVYYYIEKNSEYNNSRVLLFSIEAYLKLFVIIVIIMLIGEISKKRTGIKKRLLISLPVICMLLIITYGAQIQSYNKETSYRCYEVLYQLANEDSIENEEDTDIYIQKIKKEKEQHEEEFYVGTYHIRNSGIELVKDLTKEIYRFCMKK